MPDDSKRKGLSVKSRKYIGWFATILSAVAVVATLSLGFRMMIGGSEPIADGETPLNDQSVMTAGEIASALSQQVSAQTSAIPTAAQRSPTSKPTLSLTASPQSTDTPKPTAAPAQISNIAFELIDESTLRIKWRGYSGGIYSIYEVFTVGGKPEPIYISMTSEMFYDYNNPIPGETYTFEIRGNNAASQSFTMPDARPFDKYAFRINSGKTQTDKLFLVGSDYSISNPARVSPLRETTREDILKNIALKNDYIYEYYALWDPTPSDKLIVETRVLTSPAGNSYSRVADMSVDGAWNGLDGYRGFRSLLEECDEREGLPSGVYKVTLFWDGMYMDSAEFTVR